MMRKFFVFASLLFLSAVSHANVIAFAKYDIGEDISQGFQVYVMNVDGSNPSKIDAKVSTALVDFGRMVAISPDGSKVAYAAPYGDSDLKTSIYVMNVDGSNKIQVTFGSNLDANLRWSPNSQKITFCRHTSGGQHICTVNADGSDLKDLLYPYPRGEIGAEQLQPSFSPSGDKIVFLSTNAADYNTDLYVINTDGTDLKRLTNFQKQIQAPVWCGNRIVFIGQRYGDDVFSVAEDGTDLRQLTLNQSAVDVASSPDGSQIVFSSRSDSDDLYTHDIFTMNLDGSALSTLTNTPYVDEFYPTWGGGFVPAPTPTATPIPTATAVPTPTATPVPNATPVVNFQLPQRGIRLNNGLPFEVRVEATDADGNDDIRDVSLAVQRSSDGFFWDGRSWGPNSTTIPLTRESSGATYYKELNLGSRTQPDNYILTAVAVDREGASGSAVTSVQLIDRITPSLAIAQPANLSHITSLPAVSGTIYDLRNSDSIYSFAQRVVVSLRRGSDGKYWTGSRWSDAYTLLATSLVKYGWKCAARLPQGSELTAGPLYITAIGYDAAGNRSTVTNGVLVQETLAPAASGDGLSLITTDSATGTIRLRYTAALKVDSATNPANYAVQLGAVRVPVEDIRYEGGVVTLLLGADALPSGEAVTVTWRNLQRATGSGTFAGRTTVTVR